MSPFPDSFFHSLEQRGWAESGTLVLPEWRQDLLHRSQQLWDAGQFHAAAVGRQASRLNDTQIRGDRICWIDTQSTTWAGHPFTRLIHDLRAELNRQFYLGLRSEELHFARYDTGYGYRKHLDQHRNSRHRKISVVLYLNDDWGLHDGGELCLYESDHIHETRFDESVAQADMLYEVPSSALPAELPSPPADLQGVTRLLPVPARLVIFRSDLIWHEVLPSRRTRWSLTGWLRDDAVL